LRWLLALSLCWSCGVHADIPLAAWSYRADMLQSAWRVFGPAAPVAVLAAQIQQESAWKIDAVSWAGAQGFAQFMPGTSKDMAERFPNECAPANPFSAGWAFRCRDRYLSGLIRASRNERTQECSDWAFGLKAYNGGLGWVRKDRSLAAAAGSDPDDWRIVNLYNAGRSGSAHRENREYPERIFRLAPQYVVWGRDLSCLNTG
jgi:soluble lytic murein transglycosylase-like protein